MDRFHRFRRNTTDRIRGDIRIFTRRRAQVIDPASESVEESSGALASANSQLEEATRRRRPAPVHLLLETWISFEQDYLQTAPPTILMQDEDTCMICYRAYYADKTVVPVRLPCGGQHTLCLACLRRWFGSEDTDLSETWHNDCPVCREMLFDDNSVRPLDRKVRTYMRRQEELFEELASLTRQFRDVCTELDEVVRRSNSPSGSLSITAARQRRAQTMPYDANLIWI